MTSKNGIGYVKMLMKFLILTQYAMTFTGKEIIKYVMQYRFWLEYLLSSTLHDFALQIYARMSAFLSNSSLYHIKCHVRAII